MRTLSTQCLGALLSSRGCIAGRSRGSFVATLVHPKCNFATTFSRPVLARHEHHNLGILAVHRCWIAFLLLFRRTSVMRSISSALSDCLWMTSAWHQVAVFYQNRDELEHKCCQGHDRLSHFCTKHAQERQLARWRRVVPRKGPPLIATKESCVESMRPPGGSEKGSSLKCPIKYKPEGTNVKSLKQATRVSLRLS